MPFFRTLNKVPCRYIINLIYAKGTNKQYTPFSVHFRVFSLSLLLFFCVGVGSDVGLVDSRQVEKVTMRLFRSDGSNDLS